MLQPLFYFWYQTVDYDAETAAKGREPTAAEVGHVHTGQVVFPVPVYVRAPPYCDVAIHFFALILDSLHMLGEFSIEGNNFEKNSIVEVPVRNTTSSAVLQLQVSHKDEKYNHSILKLDVSTT